MLEASDRLLSACDRTNRSDDIFGQNLSKIRVKQLYKLCDFHLAHVSIVFTESRSNVKNFSSQTCSVLNLANLAILI